jgi:hypothetical protein
VNRTIDSKNAWRRILELASFSQNTLPGDSTSSRRLDKHSGHRLPAKHARSSIKKAKAIQSYLREMDDYKASSLFWCRCRENIIITHLPAWSAPPKAREKGTFFPRPQEKTFFKPLPLMRLRRHRARPLVRTASSLPSPLACRLASAVCQHRSLLLTVFDSSTAQGGNSPRCR